MSLARGRRSRPDTNYWPGFVDAMATLLLVITFLLSVFMVVQFIVTQVASGKDTALRKLNHQIALLTELLSLETSTKRTLEDSLASLHVTIDTQKMKNTRLQGLIDTQGKKAKESAGQASTLASRLDEQKDVGARALAQIELLNQQLAALRRQIASLEEALFFGRLRAILGDRDDVSIQGDRFVFQAEVLFPSSSDVMNVEGSAQIDKLAVAIVQLQKEIPSEINWVLRVDGHTDVRPIASPEFPSNWELSSARAISVVRQLIQQGVPPNRLVAAGFGEFQPIDTGDTEEAFRRNRRIELKLTEK
jgi:chemotaxis protein MotB